MGNILISNDNLEIHKGIFSFLLPRARHKIRIAFSTLRDFCVCQDYPIKLFSELMNKFWATGTAVEILTTPRMLRSRFFQRIDPRIIVKTCAINHLKMVLADDKILYFGTGNLTPSAVGLRSPKTREFEIGILTNDAVSVKYALTMFEGIWNGYYCTRCKFRQKVTATGCTIFKCDLDHTQHS